MREPEGGWQGRSFIGRQQEREDLKTRLRGGEGLLLLFGRPLVGKSSLAFQVTKELQAEEEENGNPPFSVLTVDCKDAADWLGIFQALCRAFSLEGQVTDENELVSAIGRRLQRGSRRKLILLLLRVRVRAIGSDVHSMTRCLQSLSATGDVMTIVTSRRQLQLPSVMCVQSLTPGDSERLFQRHAPGVAVSEFRPLLQQYCHGLPPLICQLARLASGGDVMAYTAPELREMLADDPGVLMEGLEAEARDMFTALTPGVQSWVAAMAHWVDGRFSLCTLQAVVAAGRGEVRRFLRGLEHDSGVTQGDQDGFTHGTAHRFGVTQGTHQLGITQGTTHQLGITQGSSHQFGVTQGTHEVGGTRQLCIHPLLLYHARNITHLPVTEETLLRVVTLLGGVLTRAERVAQEAGQDKAYGPLRVDWRPLHTMLRHAVHCTHDTYPAYLQVARKAETLLVKCFPHEARRFYASMAHAARLYGTRRDHAEMEGLVGMAVVHGQGTDWEEALTHFRQALPVLEQDGGSVSYVRLLNDFGLCYFRLHRLHEAQACLQLAVKVSQALVTADDQESIYHSLWARTYLSMPAIFRGHWQEGMRLVEETLELVSQLMPHHPCRTVLINNKGILFQRSGLDQAKAFALYGEALEIRRRTELLSPAELVAPLNNCAMQYWMNRDNESAVRLLEEALSLRKEAGYWHYYTALTHQHLGEVYFSMQLDAAAERHLMEAERVYTRCTPTHDVRKRSSMVLAHLYATGATRCRPKAAAYLRRVCELTRGSERDQSDAGLRAMASAVLHLAQLDGFRLPGDSRELLRWAQQLLAEFGGDASRTLHELSSVVTDVASLDTCSGMTITENDKSALRSRIAHACEVCVKLYTGRQDPREVWQSLELENQTYQKAVDGLKGSPASEAALALSSGLDKEAAGPPLQGIHELRRQVGLPCARASAAAAQTLPPPQTTRVDQGAGSLWQATICERRPTENDEHQPPEPGRRGLSDCRDSGRLATATGVDGFGEDPPRPGQGLLVRAVSTGCGWYPGEDPPRPGRQGQHAGSTMGGWYPRSWSFTSSGRATDSSGGCLITSSAASCSSPDLDLQSTLWHRGVHGQETAGPPDVAYRGPAEGEAQARGAPDDLSAESREAVDSPGWRGVAGRFHSSQAHRAGCADQSERLCDARLGQSESACGDCVTRACRESYIGQCKAQCAGQQRCAGVYPTTRRMPTQEEEHSRTNQSGPRVHFEATGVGESENKVSSRMIALHAAPSISCDRSAQGLVGSSVTKSPPAFSKMPALVWEHFSHPSALNKSDLNVGPVGLSESQGTFSGWAPKSSGESQAFSGGAPKSSDESQAFSSRDAKTGGEFQGPFSCEARNPGESEVSSSGTPKTGQSRAFSGGAPQTCKSEAFFCRTPKTREAATSFFSTPASFLAVTAGNPAPSLSLEYIQKGAERLIAAMPGEDASTREQRMALEKIASLSTPPDSSRRKMGDGESYGTSTTALQEDQLFKWSQCQGERTNTAQCGRVDSLQMTPKHEQSVTLSTRSQTLQSQGDASPGHSAAGSVRADVTQAKERSEAAMDAPEPYYPVSQAIREDQWAMLHKFSSAGRRHSRDDEPAQAKAEGMDPQELWRRNSAGTVRPQAGTPLRSANQASVVSVAMVPSPLPGMYTGVAIDPSAVPGVSAGVGLDGAGDRGLPAELPGQTSRGRRRTDGLERQASSAGQVPSTRQAGYPGFEPEDPKTTAGWDREARGCPSPPAEPRQGGGGARQPCREPAENDERHDNPRHVCQTLNCHCSWRLDP